MWKFAAILLLAAFSVNAENKNPQQNGNFMTYFWRNLVNNCIHKDDIANKKKEKSTERFKLYDFIIK